MATTKILVFLFAILVPSTIILAQEDGSSTIDSSSGRPGRERTTTAASSQSGHFNPGLDFGAFFPEFSASGHFGGRHKRSPAEDSEIEEHSREKRSVVSCKYASEGGFKCTSCKQARRCYPFNRAIVTNCSGATPYCRNGFCSSTKGALCYGTTTTTTTSTTDSSSSSTDSSSSTTGSSSTSSGSSSSSTGSSTSSTGSSSSSTGSSSSGATTGSSSSSDSSSSDSSSSDSSSSSSSESSSSESSSESG